MNSKKDICFFGKEKVGKTSIIKMIFNKTHPQDTSYLESTRELEVSEVEFKGFYKFNIMDFPGHYEASDIKPSEEEILQECGAVIYVADSKNFPNKIFRQRRRHWQDRQTAQRFLPSDDETQPKRFYEHFFPPERR